MFYERPHSVGKRDKWLKQSRWRVRKSRAEVDKVTAESGKVVARTSQIRYWIEERRNPLTFDKSSPVSSGKDTADPE